MKRLLAPAAVALLVLALGIIWGCTGSSSSNGGGANPNGTSGFIVTPAPPGQNTTGTGGGSTTTAPTTTTGTTTATTGATTATTATTGNTATNGATSTTATNTATSSATGGNTTGTTGGNATQIPVVNSNGSFPFAFTSPVTVSSDTTVVWVNQTSVDHGITWDAQLPSSSPPPGNNIPIFGPGATSATWNVPTVTVQTTYNYHCTIHGTSMPGKIIVNP